MARGLTKKVQRLVDDGRLKDELLIAAHHEADLQAHAYVGLEHVELGRLAVAGRVDELYQGRRTLRSGMPSRWWRPLGRNSALRPTGRRESDARQQEARRREGGK